MLLTRLFIIQIAKIWQHITQKSSKIDFVVVEDGKVKGIFEVTSPTTDKRTQMLKLILEIMAELMLKHREEKERCMIYLILKPKD